MADVVSGIAAIRSRQEPAARAWPRNESLATAGALAALVLVGVLLTSGFYAAFRTSVERRTREGAVVLAREGLRTWAAATSAEELRRLPVGGDSTVAAADIAAGESFVGAYAVHVQRTTEAKVLVTATGVLAGRGFPVTCTIIVEWSLEDGATRGLGDGTGPDCQRSERTPVAALSRNVRVFS